MPEEKQTDEQVKGRRPGDPVEVDEPKNVRPPSEPTPKHKPPTADAGGETSDE